MENIQLIIYVADWMLSFTHFDVFNLNTRIITWTHIWRFVNDFEKINERVRWDFSPGCCASILRNDKQINIQQPSRVYYSII